MGCGCRRFRKSRPLLCCCPKPRIKTFCKAGHFLVKSTKVFVLNSKRTACHSVTKARSRPVGVYLIRLQTVAIHKLQVLSVKGNIQFHF